MQKKLIQRGWILSATALLLAFTVMAGIDLTGAGGQVVSAQASTPALVYETTYDGAAFDQGLDMVVNDAGEAFILARAYDNTNDVMILKLSASGTVLFTKYLRGSAHDYGTGIALDPAGDVIVAGWTDSVDFPILNASQPTKNGVTRDAFIAKLSGSDGTLLFSTFFGGSRSDQINDVVLNSAGEILVTGQTSSTDFPVVNGFQTSLNLTQCFCDDAFVTRLDPQANTVLYSTYLGGSFDDYGASLGLDANENIYVAGTTHSPDFPLQNPVQASNGGGQQDLFISRISADGSTLEYSTYLGGSDSESVGRIAVSGAGQAFLTGSTNSVEFPTTPGAFQETFAGGILACGAAGFGQFNCADMFVTSLQPDGSLVYSTFIGGDREDAGRALAVNGAGEAYVVGYTASADFPGGNGSSFSIILARLSPDGSTLDYTVAITSPVANAGHGAALDGNGDIYLSGAMNAPSDLYAAKFSEAGSTPPPTPTPTQAPTASPTPTQEPTVAPTPLPTEPPPAVLSAHIGDLDGASTWIRGDRLWAARVTIQVHGMDELALSGATVTGIWSDGKRTSNGECISDSAGLCSIISPGLKSNVNTASFTVVQVSINGITYQANANHDPDGDSNGTQILISAP